MLTLVLGTVAAVYVALCAAVFFLQNSLIFFPSREMPPPAARGLPRVEEVLLTTSDGAKIHGWYLDAGDPKAAAPSTSPKPRALIVHFHGNGGNIANRDWKLDMLAREGYASLMIDWRGYGKSSDAPWSEDGLYADATAAIAWAKERARSLGDPPIVYYGESLGSGVAVEMALRDPPRALVLEAPYTRLPDVGAVHYWWLPVRTLARIRLASVDKVPRITVPLFVIHGEMDQLIPCAQGKAVHDAAGSSWKRLVIVPGAGHNEAVYFDRKPLLEGLSGAIAAGASR